MINNPFQMNDWGINHFLKVVLAVQLAILGFVGVSALGFDMPVIRQLVGFIYLTFIPGLLILRILKLHKLGTIETLLYSVGLSLAFVMALCLLMNSVYPHIGIDRPISTWPLIGTMTMAVLILSFVAYKRDRSFSTPTQFNWHQILSPPVLLLILLPLLGVCGTQIVNIFHNNILLLILIPLIALIPILIVNTNFIPRSIYPLAVIAIAMALLYHWALISNYLIGYDIHTEYYFANMVSINSFWDATIAHPYNAVLSIVMLAPCYSIICGMELTWVFKVIYPLLFSLVPLGIYQIYSKQISRNVAFLSAFFFMSIAPFFAEMIALARQEIAELFLILIILVITDKSMNLLGRRVLCLIFAISMVVSHYSMSYIFMLSLAVVLLILFLSRRISVNVSLKKVVKNARTISCQQRQIIESDAAKGNGLITLSFAAFFAAVCLAWYMWQSGSSAFISIVELTSHMANTFYTEFLNLMSSEALWLITTPSVSILHAINKYLYLFTQFLIAVGIIDLVVHWRQKEFDEEFSAFALVNFTLLIVAIALPYLSGALNTARLFQISLIFLAPFCVIGAVVISRFLLRKKQIKLILPLRAVSVLLSVFVLFSTGFVFEIANNHPYSISLSQEKIEKYGNAIEKANFYGEYTSDEDVFSAKWLSKSVEDVESVEVYATYWAVSQVHALESYGMIANWKTTPLDNPNQEMASGAYIYLQYPNVVEGIGTMLAPPFNKKETFDMRELIPLLARTNKIYANQGSQIMLVP